MTIEGWLALTAIATALLLAPHPIAALVAAFSRSWGRASGFLTVPASILAIALVGAIAAAAASAVRFYLPGLTATLSWTAIGYLMLYMLFAYQDPRIQYGLADNDNLPETRPLRVFTHFSTKAFTGIRYLVLLTAVLLAFADHGPAHGWSYVAMLASLMAAAGVAALVYAVFPARFIRRRRRSSTSGKASHKPRTLFIASRAVTAGYRRIAA